MKKVFFVKILFLLLTRQVFAVDVPIYIGEDPFGIEQNTLVLDSDDTGGDVTLQFGNSLGVYLKHDGIKFQFNDDVDFQGGELIDFRVENLASAPLCDVGASGRMFFDTADGVTYSCNSSSWVKLDNETFPHPSVQILKPTTNLTGATFSDLTFSVVDLEVDASVLERNDVDTDRINVHSDGLYLLSYSVSFDHPATGEAVVRFRVMENDSTVLPGSESESNSTGDLLAPDKQGQISQSFLAQLNDGDFITLQASTSATVALTQSINFFVVKLD